MTAMKERGRLRTDGSRKVWDLPVRVFHWVLVIAVIGAFVTNKLGPSYFDYHVWCGYTVIVAVCFRIVWGIVGTHHALFANFVRGPRETLRYLRALLRGCEPVHAGHNPLGALMVVLLLGTLGLQGVLGLFSNDEIFNAGPFSDLIDPHLVRLLSSLHRKLFLVIAAAIALHVAAVLVHQWIKREDLLKPMITGRKRLPGSERAREIVSSRVGLALILVAVLVAAFAFAIGQAPPPGLSGDI